MRILVLGGSGMIGHRIWATLGKTNEVFGLLRRKTLGALSRLEGIDSRLAIFGVDVLDYKNLEKTISEVRPQVVINCVGLVKQLEASKNPTHSIELNAVFPHRLATICHDQNTRLIHFSTDCVFDGKKGMYKEEDATSATDVYGKSKALGEVAYLENVLTIRTSTVGREVFPHGGLVEWFISQNKKTASGYKNAIYSGFPTHTLAKLIDQYVLPHPELSGVIHISSSPIDKFTLLSMIKKELNLEVDLQANVDFQMDRSLNSQKFQKLTGFVPSSWEQMVKDLNKDSDFYNSLRGEKDV